MSNFSVSAYFACVCNIIHASGLKRLSFSLNFGLSHRLTIGMLLLLLLTLAACDTPPPSEQAIRSTPVDALPISSNAPDVLIQAPTAVPQTIIDAADAEYLVLSNVYERTMPSVVNIEADIVRNEGLFADTSRGSGFIYDEQGHIVTSAHVVKDATLIRVTFNDGYVAQAEIVGIDTYSDLGVIKVNADSNRLVPLQLIRNSNEVRVGQRSIAIGNPFGLSGSMSAGIISGLGRNLPSAELIDVNAIPGFQNPSIIQTDTPINPGNSGGPLLNSNGDVIGVNTAIRTESGMFQGVGFAVPANTVRRVIPELIDNGEVAYSWMGITVTPEENGFGVAGLAEPLSLPVESGVLIRGITVNSPASKAGLRGGNRIVEVRGRPVCVGGDIIIAVNGTYVRTMDELVSFLVMYTQPGDTINLMIVREQQTFELPMTLEGRPNEPGTVRNCVD